MITYVNTSPGDYLAYPYVLRVTFAPTLQWFRPTSVASDTLASDIGGLVARVDQGGFPVVIGSDPTVAAGSTAVTIDFAPPDSTAYVTVATVVNALAGALQGFLQVGQTTEITRVEKATAQSSTGTAGGQSRGGVSTQDEQNQQQQGFQAFLDRLGAFFAKAEGTVVVVAIVAGLFIFAPEIKGVMRRFQK